MRSYPTPKEQDYLKAMHALGGADKTVTPTELALRLRVRVPSAVGMMKRLANGGWVRSEPRVGGCLTAAGLAEARRVIRRHRLLEVLLVRVLDLDWSEVDAEADALEHAVSPRVEQALASLLGDPPEDPHGHRIPTQSGELEQRHLKPLRDFGPGQVIVIREAQDDLPERLRRWRELGLVPGTAVRIISHDPLDDLFRIGIDDRVIPVGGEGLAGLLGEPQNAK